MAASVIRLVKKPNFQSLRIPRNQSMGERGKHTLCHDPACASLEHTRISNHQFKDRVCFEVLRFKMSIGLRPDVACNEADCYH
jgi:hypothetical protein